MNITNFFERDLDKLKEEISLFKNEDDIWKIKDGITNSAGNLTMHLLGNLNHFIGKTLGHTDYVRKRDEEFSLKNISREKLISDINSLKEVIKNSLSNLSDEDLKKEFPVKIQEQTFTTQNMLIYLLAHFNYHLGQVNYLRRML
ncbi:MAG: DinB family protein [Ginsengibacter sp.]